MAHRLMRSILLLMLCPAAAAAQATDLQAGKAKAEAVCAACHGANGVSVSDSIPNLAGQRGAYLAAQLQAWKAGTRKNAVMNAIGAQLSDEDIANVAAHFASLPAGGGAAKSAFLPNLAKSGVAFPANWRSDFKPYFAENLATSKQLRRLYANATALQAARAGLPLPDGATIVSVVFAARLDDRQQPVTGSDGLYVAGEPQVFATMGRDAGWGQAIPDMLRNDNWNYAVFTAAGQARPINQAECLACHKPLDKSSFVFSMDKLQAYAKTP